MAVTYGKSIIKEGLVLCLDFGNKRSYPGSGTTVYDISGKGFTFSMGGGNSWNSAGYMSFDGGAGAKLTGPASNLFGFNSASEHYIEAVLQVSGATNNTFMYWEATSDVSGLGRTNFAHLYYGNGNTYYDVSGCCGATQRISYGNDTDLMAGVRHVSWRTRKGTYPNRQFFKGCVNQMDSAANDTANVTWDSSGACYIGSNWWGNIYLFNVYNRPLSDTEMAYNYQVHKARFGV